MNGFKCIRQLLGIDGEEKKIYRLKIYHKHNNLIKDQITRYSQQQNTGQLKHLQDCVR